MKPETIKKIDELKELLKELKYLESTSAVLYWDMAVKAPEKSVEYRGEILGYLSAQIHKLATGSKMKDLMEYFKEDRMLNHVEKVMVTECRKDYEKSVKIPEKKVREFSIAKAKSSAAWEEAKAKSDFSIFKPHLEKMVSMTKEQIDFLGYEGDKYNTLLDEYERGITVEKLDSIFSQLRDAIVTLLQKIKQSDIDLNKDKLHGKFAEEKQKEFSELILEKMGYDFKAGRLDKSVHPFTIGMEANDVRITTRYEENDFTGAVFGCIHEGGHALYEQGLPEKLKGTGLDKAVSMGIHESQSLFYESLIGASKEFWANYYGKLQEYFEEFKGMNFDEFYGDVNAVKPSLIRVDADELTYCLHVIIRYEIEKDLINDRIKVEDLPEIWNQKYKEYLGVEPQNDSEGVLQDMHWSDGGFGYFPSYALGRLYSAQFLSAMKKDIPDIMKQVEDGNLENVLKWLRVNVHEKGSLYSPEEIVLSSTGESLNPKYFIDYLNNKYGELYKL